MDHETSIEQIYNGKRVNEGEIKAKKERNERKEKERKKDDIGFGIDSGNPWLDDGRTRTGYCKAEDGSGFSGHRGTISPERICIVAERFVFELRCTVLDCPDIHCTLIPEENRRYSYSCYVPRFTLNYRTERNR